MQYQNSEVRHWKGRWIWAEPTCKENSYAYFKQVFSVQQTQGVLGYLSADTRYQLYLNGVQVQAGPIQSQPYCTYYDEIDLSAYLVQGDNVVVIVGYYGGHLKGTRGGVLAEFVTAQGETIAQTDDSWYAMQAQAWNPNTFGQPYINRYAPYQEDFNANKIPPDLMQASCSDAWHKAVLIGKGYPPTVAPWSLLVKRPIPFMQKTQQEIVDIPQVGESLFLLNRFRKEDLSISLSQAMVPLNRTRCEGVEAFVQAGSYRAAQPIVVQGYMDGAYGGQYQPAILLDFGQVITAHFDITIEGHQNQKIEIGYAERLVDGMFNNALECQFADVYTACEGKQRFTSFNWRGFRYVKLIFKDCAQPMNILSMGAVQSNYPFALRGAFHANDEQLNQVFDICEKTLRLCCNESIVDTPWREQSQWVGDVSAVTLGGLYACFGETALPAKYLAQSAKNQLQDGSMANMTNIYPDGMLQSMVDYNLWWIISVWEHYQYTGGEGLIHQLYPVICKMIQNLWNYLDEYGMLYRVPYVVFIDWANHDKRGEVAPLNAIFYGALAALGEMAKLKQDGYMAQRCDAIRQQIAQNYRARFYNESLGLFMDCNEDDTLSTVTSETSNMLPFYFGLCSAEELQTIAEKIYQTPPKGCIVANPFMCFYALLSLSKGGCEAQAIALLKERWYGWMVAKGARSTYEEWSENGSYRNGDFLPIFRSHSHAWSAGPAEYLIKTLAGVSIVSPGGAKVSVKPLRTNFDYAVEYPLANGSVKVQHKGGTITIQTTGAVEVV